VPFAGASSPSLSRKHQGKQSIVDWEEETMSVKVRNKEEDCCVKK
jgi:hypothetical protein